jgi:RNA polymerase sigma factor (TIGR02999 family)
MKRTPAEVTRLLQEWAQGDRAALESLVPLVLEELRAIARRHFAREPVDHLLQPTALVNEAFLRLVNQQSVDWQNRQHFFGVASLLMRRILVDHAKSEHRLRRGGAVVKVSLDDTKVVAQEPYGDLGALDNALQDLAKVDARQAKVAEMRVFGGFSHEEIAEVLEVSVTTVKREWRLARLWLFRHLKG